MIYVKGYVFAEGDIQELIRTYEVFVRRMDAILSDAANRTVDGKETIENHDNLDTEPKSLSTTVGRKTRTER